MTETQRHRALQSQSIIFDGLKTDQLVLFGIGVEEPNRKFGSYTLWVPFRARVTGNTTLSIPLSPAYCVSQRDIDTLIKDLGSEVDGRLNVTSWQARVILSGETTATLRFVPAQDIDRTTIPQNVQDAAFQGESFAPHPLTHARTHALRSVLLGRRVLLGER